MGELWFGLLKSVEILKLGGFGGILSNLKESYLVFRCGEVSELEDIIIVSVPVVNFSNLISSDVVTIFPYAVVSNEFVASPVAVFPDHGTFSLCFLG